MEIRKSCTASLLLMAWNENNLIIFLIDEKIITFVTD